MIRKRPVFGRAFFVSGERLLTGSAGDSLVMDFAAHAATAGWTAAALRAFCVERGISSEEQAALWPAGVRSLGRQFNDKADAQMLLRWSDAPGSLREVLQARFDDNAAFKGAVLRLAGSDLFHPVDTLMRTYKTAGLMWMCRASRPAPGKIGTWLLVCLYSLCVLVWLADDHEQKATRRAVSVVAAVLGG